MSLSNFGFSLRSVFFALLSGLVLLTLALGALVVAAGRRRRGRGKETERGSLGWAEAPVPFPKAVPPSATALKFGELLESTNEWVHRRVESVEFLDVRTVRRRVSVDFTPPPSPDAKTIGHIPIALLRKNVLVRFDLRDEAGDSLPLLTSNQNAGLATRCMLGMAEEAASASAPQRLRQLCWQIARAEAPAAKRALAEIETDPGFAGFRNDRLLRIARTFVENFAVVIPVEGASRRRVIKLAYDETPGGGPRPAARLGIAPATFVIYLPDLGDAGSRHLEFLPADGLEIFDAAIVGRTPEKKPLRQRASAKPEQDEAHLFIAGAPPSSEGLAGVRLRARREGILIGGPLLAALAAGAVTAAWFALPGIAADSSGAASVILAVPAALGTFFGARNLHPLAAAMLFGSRALLVASGFASFLAASALAFDLSIDTLRWVVGAAALTGWLSVAALTALSLLLPARPKPPSG